MDFTVNGGITASAESCPATRKSGRIPSRALGEYHRLVVHRNRLGNASISGPSVRVVALSSDVHSGSQAEVDPGTICPPDATTSALEKASREGFLHTAKHVRTITPPAPLSSLAVALMAGILLARRC